MGGVVLALLGSRVLYPWLLDRFRTAVNTFGDSVGAAVVEKTLPPEGAATAAAAEQTQPHQPEKGSGGIQKAP